MFKMKIKKLFVALLSVATIVGSIPMTVFAEDIDTENLAETATIAETSTSEAPIEPSSETPTEPATEITVEPAVEIPVEPASEIQPVAEEPKEEAENPADEETTPEVEISEPVEETEIETEDEEVDSELEVIDDEEAAIELSSLEVTSEEDEDAEIEVEVNASASAPEGYTDEEYVDYLKDNYGDDIMKKIDNAIKNPSSTNISKLISQVMDDPTIKKSKETFNDAEGNPVSFDVYVDEYGCFYTTIIDPETEQIQVLYLDENYSDEQVFDELLSKKELDELIKKYGEDDVTYYEEYDYEDVRENFELPEKINEVEAEDVYFFENEDESVTLLYNYSITVDGKTYSTSDGTLEFNPVIGFTYRTPDKIVSVPYCMDRSMNDPVITAKPLSVEAICKMLDENPDIAYDLLAAGYTWDEDTKEILIGYDVIVSGQLYLELGSEIVDLRNVKLPGQNKPSNPQPYVEPFMLPQRESTNNESLVLNYNPYVAVDANEKSSAVTCSVLGNSYNVHVHDLNTNTASNQEMLARFYANDAVILSNNCYVFGDECSFLYGNDAQLVISGIPRPSISSKVYAICYNQADKAYVIQGYYDYKGNVVFDDFILRSQTNVTIFISETHIKDVHRRDTSNAISTLGNVNIMYN
ncbi:MAG: hypothetical protein MJ246_08330 [Clostridia bacterium]|nr:hypothetical protein [Clostridia bacterium]